MSLQGGLICRRCKDCADSRSFIDLRFLLVLRYQFISGREVWRSWRYVPWRRGGYLRWSRRLEALFGMCNFRCFFALGFPRRHWVDVFGYRRAIVGRWFPDYRRWRFRLFGRCYFLSIRCYPGVGSAVWGHGFMYVFLCSCIVYEGLLRIIGAVGSFPDGSQDLAYRYL